MTTTTAMTTTTTTTIPVLNSRFETQAKAKGQGGKLETALSLTVDDVHEAVVHQVVKGILAGRRQGTAATKTRGLVRGGGAKPFKQKGTGRARQGSSRSPLLVGGGTTFGPNPRDYTQKINKKVMKKAIHSVLADKFQEKKLIVVERLESNGKTKEMFELLRGKELLPALVITKDQTSLALRAVRNIEKGKGMAVEGFSVYEAIKYEHLVIEREALEELLTRLLCV